MCKPLSLSGMESSEIPVFMESLEPSERIALIMGDFAEFDGPLQEVLEKIKEGDDRKKFLADLLKPLEVDEKKILLESSAFDCLTDDEFETLRMLVVL